MTRAQRWFRQKTVLLLCCWLRLAGHAQQSSPGVPLAPELTPTVSSHAAQPSSPLAPEDDSLAGDNASAMFPHFRDSRFWLSGQMNFIFQSHPGYHADFSGPNSLSPRYEKSLSRVL